MKPYETYELILNHITAAETVMNLSENKKKSEEEYTQMAVLYLNHKGRHLFEDEILSLYREGKTLEEIFAQEPRRFIYRMNQRRNDKMEKAWYDIWGDDEIKSGDPFFDYFFACKLKHIDLLQIDEFLAFHLAYSFEYDQKTYLRFLSLTLRKYNQALMPEITDTVLEWIKMEEASGTELSGTGQPIKVKGRINREAGDHLTALSVTQTALLIEYLQKSRVILSGDYLNYMNAGKAFHLLTGYSSDTLRQQLGSKGQQTLKYEDYRELETIIEKLLKHIRADIEKL